MLEPRLTLSGSPWQVLAKTVGAGAGPTVTLSPTADAAVYAVTPYTNYGTTTDLLVQNDSSPWTTNDAESYLRFSTAGVSGTISKAVLTLTPLTLGTPPAACSSACSFFRPVPILPRLREPAARTTRPPVR